MSVDRPLTPRQHLILRLVARGSTNKEIAVELGISEQGVKAHISRLLERYRAENRVELVSMTRAWADSDERSYGQLSAEIRAARSGLQGSRDDASRAFSSLGGSLSPNAPAEISHAVTSLNDLLHEVDVATKLAREVPPETSGPLIDAIHQRVRTALDHAAMLSTLVVRQQQIEGSERDLRKVGT